MRMRPAEAAASAGDYRYPTFADLAQCFPIRRRSAALLDNVVECAGSWSAAPDERAAPECPPPRPAASGFSFGGGIVDKLRFTRLAYRCPGEGGMRVWSGR
jgi:hypothetical protein